jgi:hypothetical protein
LDKRKTESKLGVFTEEKLDEIGGCGCEHFIEEQGICA